MIHRKDCVKIITEIILQGKWNEVYNACSPDHPTKQEFYTKAAQISNISPPEFIDETGDYKVVNSDKLINELGYTFEYPNPNGLFKGN